MEKRRSQLKTFDCKRPIGFREAFGRVLRGWASTQNCKRVQTTLFDLF